MMIPNDSLNVILIGDDIETRILFKNAFSKLDKPCKVDYYYRLNNALADVTQKPDQSHIVFLDTSKNADACTNEVRQIRDSSQFKDCSLVVYDSQSHLRDTDGIFSQGADVFINQPYDFPRLRKVIGSIVTMDWNLDRFGANRMTYFL